MRIKPSARVPDQKKAHAPYIKPSTDMHIKAAHGHSDDDHSPHKTHTIHRTPQEHAHQTQRKDILLSTTRMTNTRYQAPHGRAHQTQRVIAKKLALP
jgi:hypothetical protein